MSVIIILIGFIGLAVGSFVNVLIDRLPEGENVLIGRSHCDFCKKTLRWYELIPLFSFLIQRGRCLRCHKKLSIQYPIIELVAAIGFLILYSLFPSPPAGGEGSFILLFSYWIIYLSLLVIFVADLKTFIIPDSMVVLGLIGVMLRNFFTINHQLFTINYLLSALGASLFFLGLWYITKKKGMGLGDVKLAFLLGLLLGFPQIIVALYVAFLTGALVGVILILRGKKSLKSHVPFGPFLILGYVVSVIFGAQLYALWSHFV